MMRNDAETGETLEESREHHACHGDAALERPTGHLPNLVFRPRLVKIVGAATRAERVHPDGDAMRLGSTLEDGPAFGMVQRAAVDAGDDLHPARAERGPGPVHLLDP